ncbi:MAG: SRPBCC family protein [Acidithiobacillales bacterium]
MLFAQASPKPEATRPPAPPNLEPLVTEGVVQAPVAEVWRVFSTGEGYTRLGVARAEMDFRPGGLIRSTYDAAQPLDGDAAIQTEIIAYEPMRMIATRIHRPPKGFPFKEAWRHVWTVVSLTDLGEGRTNVRVAMMGYGPDPESQAMREFFRTGNDWVLKKLQAHYAAVPPPTHPAHAEKPLAAGHPDHREEIEPVGAYFASAWPWVLAALAVRFPPRTSPSVSPFPSR